MRKFISIKTRPAGLAKTSITNEIAEAINQMQPFGTTGQVDVEAIIGPSFPAVIHDAGPDGAADFTNHRYWVKPQYFNGSSAVLDAVHTGDDSWKSDGSETILPVTNLAEAPAEPSTADGTHRLKKGDRVRVYPIETTNGTTQLTQYVIFERMEGVFPVKVTSDGGADGDKTTEASWTYTVTTLSGTTLASALALSHPRPNGKMVAGSTYGEAFYDGSTLVLWNAGEKPGTGGCT